LGDGFAFVLQVSNDVPDRLAFIGVAQ
jgi:hypothetical protein